VIHVHKEQLVKGSNRTGRRPGGGDSRADILEAALHEFAEKGFDKVSVRGIAHRAGCDAALVHQFYGTKEQLFQAAVGLPLDAGEVYRDALQHDAAHAGETIVRAFFGAWDAPVNRPKMMALLRSAMSDQERAGQVANFVAEQVFAPVIPLIAAPDPAYRINLIGGQLVGALILRHVLMIEPIASASVDDLVASIGPAIDRFLSPDPLDREI
jgi:AcrR family transcriptional regulator